MRLIYVDSGMFLCPHPDKVCRKGVRCILCWAELIREDPEDIMDYAVLHRQDPGDSDDELAQDENDMIMGIINTVVSVDAQEFED